MNRCLVRSGARRAAIAADYAVDARTTDELALATDLTLSLAHLSATLGDIAGAAFIAWAGQGAIRARRIELRAALEARVAVRAELAAVAA